MALKDVIKKARLKINLKQEDAAKLINVTVQTYSKWENGKTEPKASQISKLSKILGVSTNEICNGSENKKLELIEFMRIVSEISNNINDFETKMAIWESIEDDYIYIENLRKYSKYPDSHLIESKDQYKTPYEIAMGNDPNFYDKKTETLSDGKRDMENEEFIKSLNKESMESYMKHDKI